MLLFKNQVCFLRTGLLLPTVHQHTVMSPGSAGFCLKRWAGDLAGGSCLSSRET